MEKKRLEAEACVAENRLGGEMQKKHRRSAIRLAKRQRAEALPEYRIDSPKSYLAPSDRLYRDPRIAQLGQWVQPGTPIADADPDGQVAGRG